MELSATRIVTDDVDRLVAFYETVTGASVTRLHELFAELRTSGGTLAVASSRTVPAMGPGVAEAGANRSLVLDFLVGDVDEEYARLRPVLTDVVGEPRDMPWGNRSFLLRDPDGNLVNLFTPVSTVGGAPQI
ncbi:VOC family protein [Luteimicrobium xylanilyticum]|uniref:Lactoylglutathione lyase n=1 Tax=Luteimicrobium xylanilyticum TaxID=1133546 RepID=A0A5P9Q8Q7_9MICO|nr:VOC family protein [Luteimicrobium xylanilyticum]QFU97814.1 Lactoylglutathione lyase [Luteimicrobium xylanilyticum]